MVELRSAGTTTPRQGWPRRGRSRQTSAPSTPISTTRSDQPTRPPVQGLNSRPSLLSLSAIKDRKIKTTFRGDGDTCQASKKMQRCPQQQTERAKRSKGEMYSWGRQNSCHPSRNLRASCIRESLTTARWLPRGPGRLLLHRQGGGAPEGEWRAPERDEVHLH